MNTNTAPQISGASPVAGGALTSGATYRYRYMAELPDGSLRAASGIASVKPSRGPSGAMPRALHVYRTRANGSSFLRAATVEFCAATREVTVVDALADVDLSDPREESPAEEAPCA